METLASKQKSYFGGRWQKRFRYTVQLNDSNNEA